MLKLRYIAIAATCLLMLTTASFARSQRQSPNNEAPNAQQSAKPDQRGTPSQPLTVNIVPTAEQKAVAEEEKANAELKAADERKLIKYTGYLVVVGIVQFLIFVLQLIAFGYQAYKLRQTVDTSEKAIATTREIGEAQVRAYVKIKSASIFFLGDEAAPSVQVEAVNSGQSPALNFVWTPEVHYLPEHAPEMVSDVEQGWNLNPGIDIHAASDAKALFFIVDFPMVEKIAVNGEVPDKMGVSVILYYAWTDVFGETSLDSASFASVAEIGDADENQRQRHPLNTSKWKCDLVPIAKGQSWTGIMVKAPPNKDSGAAEDPADS
jgi:hypothetical protein